MNPQEINRRIALYCGWKKSKNPTDLMQWRQPLPEGKYGWAYQPPNYYNDLNAMHEAEKFIMNETSIEYEKWLRKLSCVWHVKASKKAEAFLRTINRWEECV
jgi:hypothetical protein